MKHWTQAENQVIKQYDSTSKSLFQIYTELKHVSPHRSFEGMTRRIRRLKAEGHIQDRPKDILWKSLKTGYLDIETTGLYGDIHYMLSWAIKERDTEHIDHDVISRKDLLKFNYDKHLVESLLKAMDKYDVLIGYNSTLFDIPFIRARCLKHKLDFFPYETKFHQDVYFMAKRLLRITRKSLAVVTEHLGIKGKTPLPRDIWQLASLGHKKSLDYVLDHNIEDVKITEETHKRLEAYVRPVKRSL